MSVRISLAVSLFFFLPNRVNAVFVCYVYAPAYEASLVPPFSVVGWFSRITRTLPYFICSFCFSFQLPSLLLAANVFFSVIFDLKERSLVRFSNMYKENKSQQPTNLLNQPTKLA